MNTKRITDFLDAIDWLFQIQNFERTLVLKENDCESVSAEIIYDEVYQTINISIYPCFFKETLESQRKILLHELIHTITLPSKKIACDLLEGKLVVEEHIKNTNERETSQIENILDALLKGKKHYAKDAYNNYIKEDGKRKKIRNKKTSK